MSTVKSFAVGEGEMYYINHNTDNFSIIDCCLSDNNRGRIVWEISQLEKKKGVTRFISTHPDSDHISGLGYLNSALSLLNFYCVRNQAMKEEQTYDFMQYCELRDSLEKAFYLSTGCQRKWMNLSTSERCSSGINVLWPDISNPSFIAAQEMANSGLSPNNISPILAYYITDDPVLMWMGDLETSFMETIADKLVSPRVNVLFAPHHGRDSGKVPKSLLERNAPSIIVIGEAPSEDLNYYAGYHTITQNSAGDITFECLSNKVRIFATGNQYSVDFLDYEDVLPTDEYLGTLHI